MEYNYVSCRYFNNTPPSPQIIEHTEFVDDSSLKSFASTKPYYKRCTQLKLQSGGKVTYIEPDQIALPELYTDVGKFPDKFIVDGFIICVDVSTRDFAEPNNAQRDFFDKLIHNLINSKKVIVVACTKFDHAVESSLVVVNEILSKAKKQIPVIEVSALKGVNVDLCFLVLAHLVDSKKPKSRIVSYADSKANLDDRIRRNEESFQLVLDQKLFDFSISIEAASSVVSNEVEYQLLRELCGTERVRKLIRAKLSYLRKEREEERLHQFAEHLPGVLDSLIPDLPLNATLDSCREAVRQHKQFSDHFLEVANWKEDTPTLQSSEELIPFGLLHEGPGEDLLQKHIDKVSHMT